MRKMKDIQFATKMELLNSKSNIVVAESLLKGIEKLSEKQMLMLECEINSPLKVINITPITDEYLAETLTIV